MPSFLIRGLAHYFAASAMESRARRQSSFSPRSGASSDDYKKLSDADLAGWQTHMRWLIPLAQATGYQIVIDNPKSHEQIIIDQNTKALPKLTLEWMQKYNKQELLEWMEKEKERLQQEEEERQKNIEARRIEETRGRARYGNSFTLGEQNAQDKKHKSQKVSKGNYVMPILCLLYVFIIVLIGLWVYNSSFFETERYEKDVQKFFSSVQQVEEDTSMNQEEINEEAQTQPFVFSSDSSWIYVHPNGCTSFKMIRVKGGVFTMGNNDEYESGPEHEVELSDFYIAETEVPQSLWKDIMGNSGSALLERNQSPKKPADGVSWDDAQAFIKALNSLTGQEFRLPTEAEWEFAAKGGNKSCGYKYSGSYDIGSVAWYGRNAYNVKPLGPDYGTHYVGEKRPNELGLYDMSGNVWEWCQDWHKDYSRKRQKNPKGPSTGRAKVVRGGCFKSSESLCTVTRRKWMWPEENSFVGVRLALSINKDN